jgi:Amiloride-sensitive sodium channel
LSSYLIQTISIQLLDRRGMNICGPYQFGCLDYYSNYLVEREYAICGCLPACSSISFESEVVLTELNMSSISEDHQKGYQYSRFTFYFKEKQFMASERTELYGTTDFLANCGGILGLCLGVSVISILEVVYFCTVRLCCNLKRNKSVTIFVEELQYFRYKTSRVAKTVRELVVNYSDKTTIQGIKYVADAHLSLLERVWWASTVVASVFCCGSLMNSLINRFDQSPLIISYANEENSVTQVKIGSYNF